MEGLYQTLRGLNSARAGHTGHCDNQHDLTESRRLRKGPNIVMGPFDLNFDESCWTMLKFTKYV